MRPSLCKWSTSKEGLQAGPIGTICGTLLQQDFLGPRRIARVDISLLAEGGPLRTNVIGTGAVAAILFFRALSVFGTGRHARPVSAGIITTLLEQKLGTAVCGAGMDVAGLAELCALGTDIGLARPPTLRTVLFGGALVVGGAIGLLHGAFAVEAFQVTTLQLQFAGGTFIVTP